MSGGRVAVVAEIEDCFVKVTFSDEPNDEPQKYTKSSVRRVLQPPLAVGARVLTKLGMVGTIKRYQADARIVTINLLGQDIQIDKCLICEVLPPDPPKNPQAKPPAGVVVK
jgi:preprotein translocase subunit YajC